MAELPARRGVAHDQQPGRLEVPGQHAVDAGPDHGRGPHDGDLQAGVAARRLRAQPLDLQPVRDQPAVRHGTQRCVLGERQRVVRQRAVDHRRRAQHHPAYAGGGGRREHGLGAADVELALLAPVAVDGGVDGQVDDRVDLAQPARQRGVPDVEDPPGHAAGLAAVVVEAHDLADVRVGHQPGRHRGAEPGGGTGDRDHRTAGGPAAAPWANGAGRVAVGGTHRGSAGVECREGRPRAQHPVDTVGRTAVMVRPSCQLRGSRGEASPAGAAAGCHQPGDDVRRDVSNLPFGFNPGPPDDDERLGLGTGRSRPAGRPVRGPDGRRRRHRRGLLPARRAAVLPGRPGQLGPGARRGPADRVGGRRPLGRHRRARAGPRRDAPRRALAGRGLRVPGRYVGGQGLEPRRVGRGDAAGVARAGRPGRRQGRRLDGHDARRRGRPDGPARRDAGAGGRADRPAAADDAQHRRRDVRHPDRPGHRRAGGRGGRLAPTSGCR